MKSEESEGKSPLHGFDDLPDVARVRVGVVAALYACCPRTIRNRVERGDIPQPEKRGGVLTWQVGDIKRNLMAGGQSASLPHP